jgi:predicted ribosome quality control (RQC) complex YloA/Tae2 family protein
MKIEIDLGKSIEGNASLCFERAKKMKRKIAGAEEAIKKARKRIEEIGKEHEEAKAKKANEIEKKREMKWYEKFRWFISSEGFLVIAGRDATTNDMIIKKHCDKDDIIFHTDLAGSPFTIIKREGKSQAPGEATLAEAAEETASFSRGWKLGLSEMEVFSVGPEQVSSTPKSGEYMPKGSFMIYGRRNVFRAKLKVAVGIYESAVMCGPVSAVKKHCIKSCIIERGSDKKSEAGKQIRKVIGAELDDIIRELPNGGIKVLKQ